MNGSDWSETRHVIRKSQVKQSDWSEIQTRVTSQHVALKINNESLRSFAQPPEAENF